MAKPPLQALYKGLRQKRVFIFDFDGVIANTLVDLAIAVNKALQHFGLPQLETSAIRCFVGDGSTILIERCLREAAKTAGKTDLSLENTCKELLSWYKKYYEEHAVEKTALYPGIKRLLERIRAENAFAAVVTNKPYPLSSLIAKKLGVFDYFTAIISPEDVAGSLKPMPDGLAEALRRINALNFPNEQYTAQDVIMIGDSPQDILAGKNFGCETCAVLKGYNESKTLFATHADFYVNLASDLWNVFA